MIRYLFNRTSSIGESSNNFFTRNRVTPNTDVSDAFIQVSVTEYDSRYPTALHVYGNSEIVPLFSVPYVCEKDQVDYSYLAYNNIGFHHSLRGSVSENTLLWEGGSNNGWALPNTADEGGTPNLKFDLTYTNYDLSDQFKIVFIHSDIPDPGNSRCFTTIKDETIGIIFNDFAFIGGSGFTRTELIVSGARTLRKTFEIDLTNLGFSDIYYIGVEKVVVDNEVTP
ncbi:hypothetical protein NVP2275O_410 [Vibrio phage 2.275.O._10N.286.54.E11]|nr:hypothetical protein NVP2275O_410 [Vibrio phage 2.275.O._10N.286.54.E11]